MTLKVDWIDRGFDPTQAPDPRFPNGVDIDFARPDERTCKTSLPYPARRCGYFHISCDMCGKQCLLTTAGRPDDPRSIKVPCQ